jgi:acetyl/propionyl-CoA carboxylase alpha subunit
MGKNASPIKRVLVANRGEIARRVIRACNELGIESVAVYTDVDRDLPHVKEATTAEPLGAPLAYLDINAIVSAAKRSGADAVHPGYGFLSENPALPEALRAEGIAFIGPSAEMIRALGSKTNAKEIAKRANVPVAPTLILKAGANQDRAKQLSDFAAQVGYPVLIKAAAGGGGRGMRLVTSAERCAPELESASREALKAFGSDEIFVERYIAPARHIEVQIAGDQHGNILALGTRDCSLQRNNQKMIEEAPATGLAQGVSEELCEAARRLASEVGYCNLGTVEFLYTQDGHFYFLEVNTRLQVEHPVTELVTGLDLVKLQLYIANGGKLSDFNGLCSTPTPRGHAIEARLCAEEYTGTFVSATGIVLQMEIPNAAGEGATIRRDMGYEVCSGVSHYYDSLLGKVIVHGQDRQHAIATLEEVLSESRIAGVGNNRGLLAHLTRSQQFISQTHSIQSTSDLLPKAEQLEHHTIEAHLASAVLRLRQARSGWAAQSPWLTPTENGITYPLTTTSTGRQLISSRTRYTDSAIEVLITSPIERLYEVDIIEELSSTPFQTEAYISINGATPIRVSALRDGTHVWVHTPNSTLALNDHNTNAKRARSGALEAGASEIISPIPGKVAAVSVAVGDQVTDSTVLLVLDSMKMEHPIRAGRSGTVQSIHAQPGAIVQAGSLLVVVKVG